MGTDLCVSVSALLRFIGSDPAADKTVLRGSVVHACRMERVLAGHLERLSNLEDCERSRFERQEVIEMWVRTRRHVNVTPIGTCESSTSLWAPNVAVPFSLGRT